MNEIIPNNRQTSNIIPFCEWHHTTYPNFRRGTK